MNGNNKRGLEEGDAFVSDSDGAQKQMDDVQDEFHGMLICDGLL